MIASNTSGYEISLRWNEYLNTYMADVVTDCGTRSYPLRAGQQRFQGIVSTTTVPDDCRRYACDMKQSSVVFT